MGSEGDDDALYLCEVHGITVGVGAIFKVSKRVLWVGYK